jgi:hypothetical protein
VASRASNALWEVCERDWGFGFSLASTEGGKALAEETASATAATPNAGRRGPTPAAAYELAAIWTTRDLAWLGVGLSCFRSLASGTLRA